MASNEVKCTNCGLPATCVGQYESMETEEPACDNCCGHACEDGYCVPVQEWALKPKITAQVALHAQVAELRAEVAETREAFLKMRDHDAKVREERDALAVEVERLRKRDRRAFCAGYSIGYGEHGAFGPDSAWDEWEKKIDAQFDEQDDADADWDNHDCGEDTCVCLPEDLP